MRQILLKNLSLLISTLCLVDLLNGIDLYFSSYILELLKRYLCLIVTKIYDNKTCFKE